MPEDERAMNWEDRVQWFVPGAMLRSYLLSTPRRATGLVEFLSCRSPRFFERLVLEEDRLIDSYLSGAMSGRARARFARYYSTVPAARARVEFARQLYAVAAAEPAERDRDEMVGVHRSLLSTPRLGVAAGVGVALALLSVFFFPTWRSDRSVEVFLGAVDQQRGDSSHSRPVMIERGVRWLVLHTRTGRAQRGPYVLVLRSARNVVSVSAEFPAGHSQPSLTVETSSLKTGVYSLSAEEPAEHSGRSDEILFEVLKR